MKTSNIFARLLNSTGNKPFSQEACDQWHIERKASIHEGHRKFRQQFEAEFGAEKAAILPEID